MRELDININIVDGGAKDSLGNVDQALDSTTAKAQNLASGVGNLEGQLAAAKTTVNNYEAAFKQLGISIDAPNKALDGARARVAALESQMGTAKSATASFTESLGNAGSAGNDFIAMADRIIERMIIYASARAVVSAVEGTIEWAVQLERLRDQLGFSVEGIQQLNYAAVETAVPLDRITAAITQMQRKMETEDGGFIGAVNRLGVNFQALKAMSPEQQFDVLTKAISGVKDQTEFAGDAAALFNSRSGASIAAVIKNWQDLQKEADDANVVLGPNQVKALADVEKAWERAKLKAGAYFATILAGPVRNVQQGGVGGTALSMAKDLAVGAVPGLPWAVDAASAYFGPSGQPSGPNTPDAGSGAALNDKKDLPPQLGQGRASLGVNPVDPNRARQLSELSTIEKELTETARAKEAASKSAHAEELAMLNLQTRLSKEYGKTLDELNAKEEKRLGVLNDQVQALRQQGQGAVDALNKRSAPEAPSSPFNVAINARDKALTGVNEQESQFDTDNKRMGGTLQRPTTGSGVDVFSAMRAKAFADFDDAMAAAATGASSLSKAHAGAVQVAGALSGAMKGAATAAGVFMAQLTGTTSNPADLAYFGQGTGGDIARSLYGSGNSGYTAGEAAYIGGGGFINKALGGTTHFADGGYAPSAMQAIVGDSPGGEYMVPAAQMKALRSGGGGVSIGDIHVTVQGNVDSEMTARRYADRTARQILNKLTPQINIAATRR